MTVEKKPMVTILIGRKTSFKIGLIKENRIVTTMLAIANVIQFEKEMLGKNQASRASTRAVRTRGLNIVFSIAQKWWCMKVVELIVYNMPRDRN
jgi:hypothetical protein